LISSLSKQLTSSFKPAEGDRPAENYVFAYWLKDGKLFRQRTDQKGNPVKGERIKEYDGEFKDEKDARARITQEMKRATNQGRSLTYIKLYK
ncbi:MAG: hypothetical protein M1426_04160, partial [Patescibacteria group bacterium]|nr:hypothetical protein [Patescibacteria group bacterium]